MGYRDLLQEGNKFHPIMNQDSGQTLYFVYCHRVVVTIQYLVVEAEALLRERARKALVPGE